MLRRKLSTLKVRETYSKVAADSTKIIFFNVFVHHEPGENAVQPTLV